MHPAEMIFFWARAKPEHLAVIEPQMSVSYAALAQAIEAVTARITQFNLADGETVAVAIDHPAKLIAVCVALMRCGIPVAPAGPEALRHLAANNIHRLIFSGDGPILVNGRNIRFDDSWLAASPQSTPRPAQMHAPAYADMIFFTSGTTGTPKKMNVPAAALMDRVDLLPMTGQGDFGRHLVVPGLASQFGFMRTLILLYAGRTVCYAPDARTRLRLISTHGIEVVVASPQQALGLVEEVEKGAQYRFISLKEIRIGGGFLSRDLARRVQSCLCRNVGAEYGATEAGLIAFANYDRIADVPNAVGFLLPGIDLEIVDETNAVVPVGEEGLVRCRTNYFASLFAANNPASAQDAADTWWYPGDLGRLTEDGMLCIGGRANDVINSGGVKVLASRLDAVVCRHPGVKDAGTCAVRDRSGIDVVWIGVVSDGDVDRSAIKTFLAESGEFPIEPKEILVIDCVPRNDLGKIQRHKLKEMLLGLKSRTLSGVSGGDDLVAPDASSIGPISH
jgi:acyl-coenzyme A synthetase/AMP-(fatty) acid ligase